MPHICNSPPHARLAVRRPGLRQVLWLAPLVPLALAGCATRTGGVPVPPAAGTGVSATPMGALGPAASPRINGNVGSPNALAPAQLAVGTGVGISGIAIAESGAKLSGGDVSLDFSDTDIRDVISQILGNILQVTYSIDPAVRGNVTFHSARPIPRLQLVPTLQTLLAENNATLIENGGVFRVAPAAAAHVPSFSAADNGAGGAVVPLRYASAQELAKVLQPIVGAGARLTADPTRNAIVIIGDPEARTALRALVESFDTDYLAGQSYALLPVPQGDAKNFATTLESAFGGKSGEALAGLVKVLPLAHANAVLVVANNSRYVEDARRVYEMVARNQAATERSWHVFYLQNSRSNDIAYTLQMAFTPDNVTAVPDSQQQNNNSLTNSTSAIGGGGGATGATGGAPGATGVGSGINGGMSGGASGVGSTGGFGGLGSSGSTQTTQSTATNTGGASALIGNLEGGNVNMNEMRIIPNPQNNAILIYATPAEFDAVEAMLRKIDLVPLEVRIDATVAEVDLNDNLNFGTQFFFKEGSVNETLAQAAAGVASTLPGFQIGAAAHGVQATLQALKAVTTVHVLSSPELMVLDDQPASLQVGSLVPYLQSSAQSTLTNTADIINSVAYQPTGVLLQVTPRINNDGQVTMDISQEVSSVATGTTTNGLNSPTFNDRVVKTRVVVQDGQTIGIAGLISDNVSKSNTGIPYLRNLPYLGFLFGNQVNTRQRQELIVMITPHVVHDQRDALALTRDLKQELPDAASVPDYTRYVPPDRSSDPSARFRRSIGPQ